MDEKEKEVLEETSEEVVENAPEEVSEEVAAADEPQVDEKYAALEARCIELEAQVSAMKDANDALLKKVDDLIENGLVLGNAEAIDEIAEEKDEIEPIIKDIDELDMSR